MFALAFIDVYKRVVESRLFRVVDDGVYFLILSFDTLHEGFLIISCSDFVEWNSIMRSVVRCKKRILMLLSLYLIFIHTKIVLFYHANIIKIILKPAILKAYLTQMNRKEKKVQQKQFTSAILIGKIDNSNWSFSRIISG